MIMKVLPEPDDARILRGIHAAIADQAAELKERAIAEAVKNFEQDLRARIGNAAINVANYYYAERIGGNLVITVRLEGFDGTRKI